MAKRPIFIPCRADALSTGFSELMVESSWNRGLDPMQKRKNIRAIHAAGREHGLHRILEVSTKSEDSLGVQLSAFNLLVATRRSGLRPAESVYQSSKVFRQGGPYPDLFNPPPREAKRDSRLQNSGDLVGYAFEGRTWELVPVTAFYDWLNLSALARVPHLARQLREYDGLTDIEFAPGRSTNCQARNCSLPVATTAAEPHLGSGSFPGRPQGRDQAAPTRSSLRRV